MGKNRFSSETDRRVAEIQMEMRWERVALNARKGGVFGPGKRWGHTCNAVKGGRFLYVFGGYGEDNCQTNDIHVFDTG